MGFHFTQRPFLFLKVSTKISLTAIFFSIAFASFETVWSMYLDSFVHSASIVGVISGTLTLLMLLFFLFLTPIIEKYSEKKVYFIGTIGILLSYLMFFLLNNIILILLVSVFYVFCWVIFLSESGLLISKSANKKDLGRAEGIYGVCKNLGWLFGPLFAGLIIENFKLHFMFLFCALFTLIGIVRFKSIKLKTFYHKVSDANKTKILTNLKQFFSNKDYVKCYIVSGGIPLYWGVIFTFVPLYIIRNSYPAYYAGMFLFAVAIPLVLFEYTIGKMVDKLGHKIFFVKGYLIIAFFCLFAFFSPSVKLSLLLLVFASIGASFLENTKESYFFKITKRVDEKKYYGSYNTYAGLFSTIGKALGALLLLFFPINTIFVLLAIEMCFFMFVSLTIKDC